MKYFGMRPRKNFVITLAALGIAAASAQGALVAYDQFTDYTDGSLNGQGQGFGWGSNNWSGGTSATQEAIVSSSSNLNYTGLATAGGGVTAGTNSTSDNMFHSRVLGSPITASGVYYFGFLLQRSGDPSKAGLRINNSDESQYAGGGSWDSFSNWQLYTREGSSFPTTSTGIAETTDVTHFVIKMDFTTSGSHTAYLYVDPTDATELTNSGLADASYDFGIGGDWDQIHSVRANNVAASGNTGSMAFDEIRIGTEADDMFSAIPEPSTLAWIGLAGMATFLRRRRS